jgi:hypothetical protein
VLGALLAKLPAIETILPTVKTVLSICGLALVYGAVCIFPLGKLVSESLKIAPVWGFVSATVLFLSIPLSILLGPLIREEIQKKKAEQHRREHEAWLQTPQGKAWQEEERERLRKLTEEGERQRKEAEETAARALWRLFYESKTMDDISRMTGRQFEEFLARLFSRMGYRDVTLTPTNDQGGDLLCTSPTGSRVVVQAKRWKGTVGNGAVQELLGAMLHYDCAEGMVVTNSTFTAAAHELAKKDPRISLGDRRWLEEQIKMFLPASTPEFSWEEYNRVVKGWQPPRAGGARRAKSRRYWRRRW